MRFPWPFGRKAAPPEAPEAPRCSHLVLLPTWDEPADMGKEERATGYRCGACGTVLTIEEAAELRKRNAIAL